MLSHVQGREAVLFEKLANKYKVQNPLLATGVMSTPNNSNPPTPLLATNKSSQEQTPSGFSTADSSLPSSTPSFPTGSPFTTSNTSSSSFPSPFGTPIQSPGGAPKLFAGKTPREILVACFEKYNPSKLGSVDNILAKYRNKEEEMIVNLATKYKFDPSEFGIPPRQEATPQMGFGKTTGTQVAFGQASPLGGGMASFGQPSALGVGGNTIGGTTQSSSAFGSGTAAFGSAFGAASSASSSGFGALASAGGSTFGSTPTPFSSPFGAPRK